MGPFSLNLLLVVLLLLPGLVFFVAEYQDQPYVRRRAMPTTASLAVLTAVPLAALIAHTSAAVAFWAAEAIGRAVLLFPTPFDPNPYRLMFVVREEAPSSAAITYLLGYLLTLSTMPALIVEVRAGLRKGRELDPEKKDGEDWLSYLLRLSAPDDAFLVCYVLTTFGPDDEKVGYDGVVVGLQLDDRGEVASVTLDECYTFRLHIGRDGLKREPDERETPLRYVTICQDEIINTSFEVIVIEEEA